MRLTTSRQVEVFLRDWFRDQFKEGLEAVQNLWLMNQCAALAVFVGGFFLGIWVAEMCTFGTTYWKWSASHTTSFWKRVWWTATYADVPLFFCAIAALCFCVALV